MSKDSAKAPKRRRKGNARTQASSSSSSESGARSSPEPSQAQTNETSLAAEADSSDEASANEEINGEQLPAAASSQQSKQTSEELFDAFYLRQMTTEFAEDLDKLRSASDFNDRSVPLLVNALKQGRGCFSKGERERVGKAGAKG